MKIKYFSTVFLISSLLLISCAKHYDPSNNDVHNKNKPATTTNFLGNQVFMAFGTNFKTGEVVAFNTLNGSKLAPCPDDSGRITKSNSSYNNSNNSNKLNPNQRCGYKLINTDDGYKVINPAGRRVQKAIIRTFTIASFEGSICVIGKVVGGIEYTGCYEIEQVCDALNGDPVAKERYKNTYNQYCL